MKKNLSVITLFLILLAGCSNQEKKIEIQFAEGDISTHAFALKHWDIPKDWSTYDYLVLEFKASSPQRFEVGLHTTNGYLYKRIHPFAGVQTRFVVPLGFYRQQPTSGHDMAATWNQPRTAGWMNVENGGFGEVSIIDSIVFRMIKPIGSPTLEMYSLRLSVTDPGDSIISPQILVDQFGQWIPQQWEGKAKTIEDLQAAWEQETETLQPGNFNYGKYGGYLNTQVKGNGFFRVEKVDGRWWFVDPEGHLFLSTSANGINPGSSTVITGRQHIYEQLPAEEFLRSNGPRQSADFTGWNISRRYGDNWRAKWEETTKKRLEAWGFTTAPTNFNKPYITYFRGAGISRETSIMGIPDVYSKAFAEAADQAAQSQCATLKSDPWLIGYFIGNEPPWPNRESLAVNKILEGPDTETRRTLEAFLKEGDTPERRVEFCKQTFRKFLDITLGAIRKYDPNHLILGIRFGGTPPDYLMEMASVFDVYSLNTYAYKPNSDYLDKVARLSGNPILIGEYHFGTPGKGLASGLCQVEDQENRGVAYRYYTENAFAHSNVIGAHWFQWNDQPSTGRNDGENYNIGIIDVADRPYKPLTDAIVKTHSNLYQVHAGLMAPSDVLPEGRTKVDFDY